LIVLHDALCDDERSAAVGTGGASAIELLFASNRPMRKGISGTP
jgi:hypothetical protein